MRYSNSLSWEVPPPPTTVFSMSFAVYHTHFRSACTWEQSCLALSIFSFSRYHCSFSKWCAEFFSHSGVKIPAPLSSSPKLGLDSRADFLPLHSFLVFIILCVCGVLVSLHGVIFLMEIGQLFMFLLTIYASFVITTPAPKRDEAKWKVTESLGVLPSGRIDAGLPEWILFPDNGPL